MHEPGHAELMRALLWATLVLLVALGSVVVVGWRVFRREEERRRRGFSS